MKKLIAIVLAGLIPAAAALAADPGWPSVIRLGLVGNAYNKPFTSGPIGRIQQTRSFDTLAEQHGSKVEWNFFTATGPAINEAWANHTIDIGSSGDLPSLIGLAGGLKTKVLAGSGRAQIIYVGVLTGSPIKTWDDLKGKKVTFQKGTYLHLVFDKIIKDRGETEDDYKIYSLLSADQTTALLAGQVDAVVGTTNLLTLRKQGSVRIIYKTSTLDDTKKYLGYGNVAVTQEYIDKYPDVVQAFVDQFLEASVYLSQPEHREEVFQLVASTGATSSEAREDLGHEPESDRLNPLLGPAWIQHQQDTVDYIKSIGLIRNGFDFKSKVDDHFLNNAVQKLNDKGVKLPSDWDPS
jgi:sulfonate transport system substrate-binding protein